MIVKTNLDRQINRAVNLILCATLFPLVAMYSGLHYATTNDVKTKDATTNECYNEEFLSIKSGFFNGRGGILSADVARACA
jgi:hypothetical protein